MLKQFWFLYREFKGPASGKQMSHPLFNTSFDFAGLAENHSSSSLLVLNSLDPIILLPTNGGFGAKKYFQFQHPSFISTLFSFVATEQDLEQDLTPGVESKSETSSPSRPQNVAREPISHYSVCAASWLGPSQMQMTWKTPVPASRMFKCVPFTMVVGSKCTSNKTPAYSSPPKPQLVTLQRPGIMATGCIEGAVHNL